MCPPELNLVYMSLYWVKIEESTGSESFVMGNEYLDKMEDNASNEFQELRDIWAQWDDEAKQLFYQNYGDLPYLLDVKVDRHLFRAMEYTALLRCPRIQGYKAYVRPASLPTFTKKLVMITGISEQWAAGHVQQKGDSKCIPWVVLRDLISTHPDVKKRVDVLALSIYGLVIFPKALGHIDEVVADLFDRLGKQNTPVPAILAETFRSLSACRRAGEERFIGCAQLLLVWFHSHFWKVDKVPCRVFFKDYSSLKEAVDMPKRDDISEERWIDILQNLQEEDGVVGYAPLLVLRQYRARQFIPATQGLAQSDFSYKGDHYKKRMQEISEAWKKPFCMKILTKGSTSTLEGELTSDSIIVGGYEARVREKELELEKWIEKLEEEKMYLSLHVDVQKREVEKVKKEKRKIEEDRDDLKTHYKKAQITLKRVGLGRSLEQWQQEIQEEMVKTEYWEKKFQEMQSQNQALEKKNQGLKAKVIELGRSLHYHRSRNSTVELKASLNKIEEMKHNIGRLETTL
ncbi:hypothetical protein CXB51_009743 [Gossypium anomalum]|uniref:DUF7745 domain-containing protein n=1 Tax=Gossypium anomalum TaxID=47600 RepID=A0A8J5ZN20_9ROSI|nr:hypothetical protein CXB51_009743 [Gossypium anomalum]